MRLNFVLFSDQLNQRLFSGNYNLYVHQCPLEAEILYRKNRLRYYESTVASQITLTLISRNWNYELEKKNGADNNIFKIILRIGLNLGK